MPVWGASIVILATALAAVPPQSPAWPVRVAESVDLDRYAGQWFEIARLPNKTQTACATDVTARYAVRPDGRLDVINRCRTSTGAVSDAHGLGRKAGQGSSAARLQMRFASPFRSIFGGTWSDYWILGIGPDYTWAVAGSPSRERLWILSRTPEMSAASYERAVAVASGNGFDVSRLIRTQQNAR